MSRWRAVYLVARGSSSSGAEAGRSSSRWRSRWCSSSRRDLPAGIIGGDDAETLGVVGTPPAQFAGLRRRRRPGRDRDQRRADPGRCDRRGRCSRTKASTGCWSSSRQTVAPRVTSSRNAAPIAVPVGRGLCQPRPSNGPARSRRRPDRAGRRPGHPVRELEPSDPARETAFLFANVGVILLFIAIFTFGTWVLTGVVEEKQSRVVEVVLSTVPARDLLVGKVLGIGLLGLVQLVIIVVIGLGRGTLMGRFTLPPTTGPAVAMLLLWFVIGYVFYSTALGGPGRAGVADGGGVERVEPGQHRGLAVVRLRAPRRGPRPGWRRGADRDVPPAGLADGRPAAGGARGDRAVGDRARGRSSTWSRSGCCSSSAVGSYSGAVLQTVAG